MQKENFVRKFFVLEMQFLSLCIQQFKLKMSRACFFTALIRLNPTTDTPLPDHPARFLIFFPNCKNILMNFTQPR